MCWVMPPASPATTSVSRIASSSDVLPWSTWPMIVTTGGRSTRAASSSANDGSTSSSSPLWTISTSFSNSSASARVASSVRGSVSVAHSPPLLDFLVELLGEHLDGVVGQRLRERRHLAQAHQLLDDLRRRDAEVLGDILDGRAGVDPDDVGALLRLDVELGRNLGEHLATPTAA